MCCPKFGVRLRKPKVKRIMITKKDFMKDYKQMTSAEQKDYIERVEKWND
jgi:hypothetical protein